MTTVHKTAAVPYSAEEMYALVNDIESYPQFLPWCTDARVENREDGKLTASVSLSMGTIRQSFTTENTMDPGRRISVRLIEGPFRHLNGYWDFEPHKGDACRIQLYMEFEFTNRVLKMTLEKAFTLVVSTLIDAFTRRARHVYGKRRR